MPKPSATTRSRLRLVSLFVVAVLLPCLLLLAVGLRMIAQERELSEKRRTEQVDRWIQEIRQELLARLETLKYRALSGLSTGGPDAGDSRGASPAEVLLTARIDGEALQLPWPPADLENRRRLREPAFVEMLARGELEEFAHGRPAAAVRIYRDLIGASENAAQRAFASLSLARALQRAGNPDSAATEYRAILDAPSEVTDEHDVPLALYAARGLVLLGAHLEDVTERLRIELQVDLWPTPKAAYLLRSLIEELIGADADDGRDWPQERLEARSGSVELEAMRRRADRCIENLERLLELQGRFPELLRSYRAAAAGGAESPLWFPLGPEPWLLAVVPRGEDAAIVVVVDARRVFATLQSRQAPSGLHFGESRLVTQWDRGAEPLGAGFPGLGLALLPRLEAEPLAGWGLRGTFYGGALVTMVSLTLFGAYLLWRDVRREVHLAEVRSRFVSAVSHELRTPLTSIRMYAESLRMGRPRDPDKRERYLDTIAGESERLSRLLDNVLDFAKVERGERTYQRTPTDLGNVAEAAVRSIRQLLARGNFDIAVRVEPDLPPVPVDPDAVERAVLNLLTNAMKYSRGEDDITLDVSLRDAHVAIAVTDRGVGIAPEEQERIFEEFYRTGTPENDSIPGTGLGLTLVRHIVESHGGKIEVESVPGHGSTFTLLFPLREEGETK